MSIKSALNKATGSKNNSNSVSNVNTPRAKPSEFWKPKLKKAGKSLKRSFTEPSKKKERASIGKQLKKGIHKTLFKGKKKLI